MSQYKSDYPSVEVDPAYKNFFESFYKISDTPSGHQDYANQFTKDGILIIASKKVQGYDDIVAMRHGMWEKVASRSHHPTQVYPFGPNSDNVMLYGTVDYTLKDGRGTTVEWAARAHLVKDGAAVKMDYYQVYLDTAAMNPK